MSPSTTLLSVKCECGYEASHRAFPVYCRCGRIHHATETADALEAGQPGTELARLIAGDVRIGPVHVDLSRIGFTPKTTCGCEARIEKMNRWGIEGCQSNRPTIVGWLQQSAAAAGITWLPELFFSQLVGLALCNARKRSTRKP